MYDVDSGKKMKILVVGRYYEEAFASFVAQELEALSHTVVRYDPGPPTVPFGSRLQFYTNRMLAVCSQAANNAKRALGLSGQMHALRKLLSAGDIDLTISTHDYLNYEEVSFIKAKTRSPVVLWYPDPIWSFQRHMFLNAPYDLMFFKDPYLVDLIRSKLRKQVLYLPECFSPTSLGPVELSEEDRKTFGADICTAGNLYAYRVALFSNLSDFDAKIWGLPAPRWLELGSVSRSVQNRFVAHSAKAKAFRGAKIVLNTLNPAEIWGTNVRTFEICGAGAFQITDRRPGLGQLFEIGREIVCFDDVDDLRQKVTHFLSADDERREIAEAGLKRATAEHTYTHRLKLLMETVSGCSQGYPQPKIVWGDNGSS
jgi:spore maturation protein CgeB